MIYDGNLVESWREIDPKLPENLDNIEEEEIYKIFEDYVAKTKRQKRINQTPVDTDNFDLPTSSSVDNKSTKTNKKRDHDGNFTSSETLLSSSQAVQKVQVITLVTKPI